MADEAVVEVQVHDLGKRVIYRRAAGSGGTANRRHVGRETGTASPWVFISGLFALVSALTGCANACTAIGWFDELKIEITGPGSESVDRLEVCFDGSCYSGGGADTPGPETPLVNEVSVVKSETGWKVTTSMQIPEAVQLRASSETGEVLADQEAELDWKRVGGTARCGGPHEAEVVLTLNQ